MTLAQPPIVPPAPPGTAPAPPPGPLRPFSVDEYHRLVEVGVLTEDDPVELLEGWIVFKMPKNPRHDNAVFRVQQTLSRVVPADWLVRVQSAITTGDSEPEPDVAVASGPVAAYDTRHPRPTDIALVVEVADTSITRDRLDKQRLYARASIREYWIVNLGSSRVEVYVNPSGVVPDPSYHGRTDYAPGESIPLRLGGSVIPVAVQELFP